MIGIISAMHALLLVAAEFAPTTTWVRPEAVRERLDSVWRPQGYGRLMVLRSGTMTLYHAAGPYCYRDPSSDAGSDESLRLVTIVSQDHIAFAETPEQTRYVFDRIAALLAACLTKRSWTPAEIGRLVAANRRRLAFEKQAIAATAPFQPFHVDPSASVRHLGPVTLLTSDITVSAGETFTLAMRALPNVRHAGRRTRGALSDQLAKPLPNGWILTRPAETYRATNGHMYEGIGISANLTIRIIEGDHAGTVAQIAKSMGFTR